MKYQIYAYDAGSRLNHAGVHNMRGEITPEKLQKVEKQWAKWRKKYLAEHPGVYPLREHDKPSVMYYYHPAGKADKTRGICID